MTLFLLIFVGSLSFYQNDEVKTIVEDNSKVLKKIEQDKNVTNYLIEDVKKKDLKYAKLEVEYESLRKSIQEKAPNAKEIIDNANKILKERGIESAIYYCKNELFFLEKKEKMSLVEKEENPSKVEDSLENIDEYQEQVEVIETNKTLDAIMTFIDNTVEIDGLIYENIPFTNECTWSEAKQYCEEKEGSWRLPTSIELYNISNIKMYGLNNEENESKLAWNIWFEENKHLRLKASNGKLLFIHEEFLENMRNATYFWTKIEKNNRAIRVRFDRGYSGFRNKNATKYVLCVSGQ